MADRWEEEAKAAAFKIVPLLKGMSLAQAIYTLKETKHWLLNTHRVDTQAPELTVAVLEFENAHSR
jgi:hypothetical protein